MHSLNSKKPNNSNTVTNSQHNVVGGARMGWVGGAGRAGRKWCEV